MTKYQKLFSICLFPTSKNNVHWTSTSYIMFKSCWTVDFNNLKLPWSTEPTTPRQPLAANRLHLALSTVTEATPQYWVLNEGHDGVVITIPQGCLSCLVDFVHFLKIRPNWKHFLDFSHLYTHIYVICIAIHTMYWFLDSQSWYTDWLKTRLTMESRLLLLTNITLSH